MSPVEKPIALVTGAAGGVGRRLTKRLLAENHHVVMLDINPAGLASAKEHFGDGVTTIVCDLTDPGSIAVAAQQFHDQFHRLDVIINNAGAITPGPFVETTEAAIEKQMLINLLGPMRILNAFLPFMTGRGAVINIGSMAAILPLKDSAVYSAGKFGLRGFSLALALELNARGIKVSGIYPSSIDTPMLEMEARSGGSPLNFLADPLPPEKVVDVVMLALKKGELEYYVPFGDSVLSRLLVSIPWLLPRLLPHFEKKGLARQQRYVASLQGARVSH